MRRLPQILIRFDCCNRPEPSSGEASALHNIHIFHSVTVCFAHAGRATLTGTDSDQGGKVIPAARVVLHSSETNLEYAAVTNKSGTYVVSPLPVGRYLATATAAGFEKLQFAPFSLQVGENRFLDAALPVASVNTVVQVTSVDEDLNRISTEVGGVVQGAQLNELPMPLCRFERLPFAGAGGVMLL
jgi:hypothetical protein